MKFRKTKQDKRQAPGGPGLCASLALGHLEELVKWVYTAGEIFQRFSGSYYRMTASLVECSFSFCQGFHLICFLCGPCLGSLFWSALVFLQALQHSEGAIISVVCGNKPVFSTNSRVCRFGLVQLLNRLASCLVFPFNICPLLAVTNLFRYSFLLMLFLSATYYLFYLLSKKYNI